MATTKKKAAPKKKSPVKKAAPKKATVKKKAASKKLPPKKNKLGVKNSLVNNINVKKKKGTTKSKKNSTVDKDSYAKMEDGWKK